MGFSKALTSDIGKVRLEIGDDTIDQGVLPEGGNFDDAAIQYFLDIEGSHIMRSAAAALETLARRWSLYADRQQGPARESASQVAKAYKTRAAELRGLYGYGNTTQAAVFAVGTVASNPADTSGEYSV